MSTCFPSRTIVPVVTYRTTFGFVEMERLKPIVTSSGVFFCSSSFAFTSKKSSSDGRISPALSACRLSIRIETMTPATEYFGLMLDSFFFVSCYYTLSS
jgi:hypothetical protein